MGWDLIRDVFLMSPCDIQNRLKGGQNGNGELRDSCSSLEEQCLWFRGNEKERIYLRYV